VSIERQETICDVDGHSVRVDWFAPAAGHVVRTVVLLHGRDGPDGVAGDRPYWALATEVAAGGFQVALPWYFARTPDTEPTAGELDALGQEVERYGLWLRAIGEVLRAAPRMTRPFGLLGYSLGGYLALTAAMSWPGVAAVAACYAGVPTPFADLAARLPPALVLHGADDPVVPASEATALARLLRRHRVPHEVHVYSGAGHGFRGPDAEDAIGRVVAFFRRHLGSAGRAAPGTSLGGDVARG